MKILYIAIAVLASLTARPACGSRLGSNKDEDPKGVASPPEDPDQVEEPQQMEIGDADPLLANNFTGDVITQGTVGYIKIHGHCLDIYTPTKNVHLSSSCHTGNDQKWYFYRGEIKTRYNYWCLALDTEQGHNVEVQPCDNGLNQKWSYVDLHFVNHYNGKCLDHWHGADSTLYGKDQNVHLYTCYDTYYDQKWYPDAGFFF